jgi:hypothetical protein
MNLNRLMFWRQDEASEEAVPLVNLGVGADATPALGNVPTDINPWSDDKVTTLRQPSSIGGSLEEPALNDLGKGPGQVTRVKGLMSVPELEAFFKTNQYSFGRHHGSKYRTQEALDRGLQAVITSFQNIVSDLTERRQARINKLQQTRQEVATLSPSMAETLRLACEQTQREIVVLNEQHALAEKRKGWVLDALNRYQLGFDRGVRDALDFELLNA